METLELLERPENVLDFRGGPEWETALTMEQRTTLCRLSMRWASVQMEFVDNCGAVLTTVTSETGGTMVIGVEKDGYAHS